MAILALPLILNPRPAARSANNGMRSYESPNTRRLLRFERRPIMGARNISKLRRVRKNETAAAVLRRHPSEKRNLVFQSLTATHSSPTNANRIPHWYTGLMTPTNQSCCFLMVSRGVSQVNGSLCRITIDKSDFPADRRDRQITVRVSTDLLLVTEFLNLQDNDKNSDNA